MSEPIGGLGGAFLDEVRDWLLTRGDPRLSIHSPYRVTMNDAAGACADFCEFMSRICEAGGQAKDWRHWMHLDPGPGRGNVKL